MIISHLHKFVFVEIPHTGSHSISAQLMAHYGGKSIIQKHANVTQFMRQATSDEKRYFKFATVRNPLDIAVTEYLKLKNNHKKQFTEKRFRIENGGHVSQKHRAEFAFIHENSADFSEFFRKFRARMYNNWFLLGRHNLNHIIRFERLQEGFSEVLRHLEIDEIEPLGHVNPTKDKTTRPYEDYYSAEVIELAVACYGPFMKEWGYEFPEYWHGKIPASKLIQFKFADGAIELLSRWIELDPNNRFIRRGKRLIDRLTSLPSIQQ